MKTNNEILEDYVSFIQQKSNWMLDKLKTKINEEPLSFDFLKEKCDALSDYLVDFSKSLNVEI
jgi:hypothetical protein